MSVRKSAFSIAATATVSLALLVGPGMPQARADEISPSVGPTAPLAAVSTTATTVAPTGVSSDPVKKQTKAQKLKAKADAVIRAAKSKVAKGQYKWGAAGPNSFDCSGFVVWSFKKVGINLPHSSRAQATKGAKVARKNLKPGDLVFFYSPVSHVAIYIGNGKIVHARNTRDDLEISNLKKYGHYHSARRVIR
ncbi:MAG: C40 family peptidase [Micropruina sp.]|uniref:C40 family peptidase n=1 Tax=Micropruina sp. TaxID=2737536 RepID=UPI0039E427FD